MLFPPSRLPSLFSPLSGFTIILPSCPYPLGRPFSPFVHSLPADGWMLISLLMCLDALITSLIISSLKDVRWVGSVTGLLACSSLVKNVARAS